MAGLRLAPPHRPWKAAQSWRPWAHDRLRIWQPRPSTSPPTPSAPTVREEGFPIWNGQWYGGPHLPRTACCRHHSLAARAPSRLRSPPGSDALFPPLVRGCSATTARAGAIWFVAGAPLCSPSRLPFAIGARSPRGALAFNAATTGWRSVRRAVPARQPGCRAVPRDGGRGLRDRGAGRPPQALRGTRDRRRGVLPAGLHGLGIPRGRLGAVPDVGLRPDSGVRARVSSGSAARAERAALGRGALRPRRHARARDRDPWGNRAPGACSAARSCVAMGRPWTKRVWRFPDSGRRVRHSGPMQWSPRTRRDKSARPAAKSDYFTPSGVPLSGCPTTPHRDPFTRSHGRARSCMDRRWRVVGCALDRSLPDFYRRG